MLVGNVASYGRGWHISPRSEFRDAIDGMAVGNAGQHILQIGEGFHAAQSASLDDGCDLGPMLRSTVASGEQSVAHSQFLRSDGAFDGALIHLQTSVGQEAAEIGPARQAIADLFGQFAAAGDAFELLLEPDMEVFQ